MGAVYDKYYNEVYKDACDAVDENFDSYLEAGCDLDDAWDVFYEDLYMDDSVTGNASGSYWFSRKKAEESLGEFDIIWLLDEMGYTIEEVVKRGPEVVDVIIRCAMLYHVEDAVKKYVWEMFS